MNIKDIEGSVCASLGFKAAGIPAGIKKNGVHDLMMILCDTDCAAAACYTQNKVKGAPLTVTGEHIADGHARGMFCNSGNANTCNPDGIMVAKECCELAADSTGLKPSDFIVASTGVIGQGLPLEPFRTGIPKLAAALSENGGGDAAKAIMTTDTRPKEFAVEFLLEGRPCRIGGICKGSGMINPNMATMLVFLTTDTAISSKLLQAALQEEMNASFNQLCIDGDTSTNDMVSILASGQAGNAEITVADKNYDAFCAALHEVCVRMCRALAADGEGATKLLECHVTGAPNTELAHAIAKSVIASDLFKSAMFGADANWGRALCAIGYTPGDFSADRVTLRLKSRAGEVLVCENSGHKPFSEEDAARILAEDEISVLINLNDGEAAGMAWGCDLTYDYVKINGDYRT